SRAKPCAEETGLRGRCKVHVLACFNPACGPRLENFRPARKILQAQKFSHAKIFCSPSHGAREHPRPSDNLTALGEHCGPRAARSRRESSDPGAGGRCSGWAGVRRYRNPYTGGLKTAAGAKRQADCGTSAPPAPSLFHKPSDFTPLLALKTFFETA